MFVMKEVRPCASERLDAPPPREKIGGLKARVFIVLLRFTCAKVESPVVERPRRIIVGRDVGELLHECRAKGLTGKKLKVAMKHESTEILLEFLSAGDREARLLNAGLDVLKSSGPKARSRTFGVGEKPGLGKLAEPL